MSGAPPDPLEREKLRPYRVAMYVLFLAFTLLFIGLIVWSVATDLYGRGPVRGLRAEQPSMAACVDELESLFRKLASRSALAMSPNEERDWDAFTREFEDRLDLLKSRCVDAQPTAPEEVRRALADAADQLEMLRLHLSRCGEEGERERAVLLESIRGLRAAVRGAQPSSP